MQAKLGSFWGGPGHQHWPGPSSSGGNGLQCHRVSGAEGRKAAPGRAALVQQRCYARRGLSRLRNWHWYVLPCWPASSLARGCLAWLGKGTRRQGLSAGLPGCHAPGEHLHKDASGCLCQQMRLSCSRLPLLLIMTACQPSPTLFCQSICCECQLAPGGPRAVAASALSHDR